jgi:hypothetical protein
VHLRTDEGKLFLFGINCKTYPNHQLLMDACMNKLHKAKKLSKESAIAIRDAVLHA